MPHDIRSGPSAARSEQRPLYTRRLMLAAAGWLFLGVHGAFADETSAAKPADKPDTAQAEQKPARLLFVSQSKGFVHGSVNRGDKPLAPAEVAVVQLGQQSKLFSVDCTQDVKLDFTQENLTKYDGVCFYTTGDLGIPAETMEFFLKDWLAKQGKAVIGFHSASDTYNDYEPYWDMIGGTFDGHPWNSDETVSITVHDQEHPAMRPLGADFEIKEEIYQYKHFQPEKVRVLMSLNMAKCKTKRPHHVPVAWVKNYGEGRVFYSNLGHNESTWTNPKVLDSVLGGVSWALKKAEGEAKPNPELSKAESEKAAIDAKETK